MAEKEYIEREMLIEEARNNKAVCQSLADIVDIQDIINNVSAADVQPVKHGHWTVKQMRKPNYNYGVPYEAYFCSLCGYKVSNNGLVRRYNYCPNCGARMDGEKK